MAPQIHALTVCVDYSQYLIYSLPRWMLGCASVTVVTTYEDEDTLDLCTRARESYGQHYGRPYNLLCLHTYAFTQDGASFNKGAAMEEARLMMPWQDWILFFDADVVPEIGWQNNLGELQLGYLYGCKRRQITNPWETDDLSHPIIPDDRVGYGYFQLFHSADPKVQRTPLLETHWRHAGNADSNFLLSFRSMVKELPINLWHLGAKHENWFGVGKEEEFREMQKRRGGQGIHPSEKV